MEEYHFDRLEMKYLIGEETAARVRADLALLCDPDEHNDPRAASGHPGYGITSLYLDTPDLRFHREKVRGLPHRQKLRIRSYGSGSEVSFEVKRKAAEFVHKDRSMQSRRSAARLLAHGSIDGEPADPELSGFLRMAWQTGAEPRLLVRYEREAFRSTIDEYARVTFDRNIQVQSTDAFDLEGHPDHWIPLHRYLRPSRRDDYVVLELKCQRNQPGWMLDLVRRHGLVRCSVSKYSMGIYASLREQGRPVTGKRLGALTGRGAA